MIPLDNLLYEVPIYLGLIIFATIYGIYLGVYYLSTLFLWTNTNITRAQRTFYITYGSVLFLLNTINFVGQAHLCQMMWITDRDKSAGDIMEYYNAQSVITPLMMLGNEAQNVAAFLADVLLIYRCYIIFGSRWYIVLLPALCAIGSIVLSTVTIAFDHISINNDWVISIANAVEIAAIMLTTATNIIATTMICFKILSMLYGVQGCVDSRMKRTYTNIVALLVESAAPSAALGIIISAFQISYGLSESKSALISTGAFLIWSSSIALFPQLIIFRIAQGNAWTKTTSKELTQATGPVVFAPREDINWSNT